MKPFVKTTSSIAMLLMLPIGALRAENSVPDGYSLVQVPDDAVIQLYHVTGTAISFPDESSEEHFEANYIVSVAIDNDEIYIQGLPVGT